MEILGWIIVGFIAGLLAKAIMPGTSNEPGGFVMTILLGIAGAFIGGFLFKTLMGGGETNIIGSIVVATIGAILLIGMLRLFSRNAA